MPSAAEAEQFRRLGYPEIWTIEGAKVLGKLMREGRAKILHPARYRPGISTDELADYITEVMTIRGAPFRISEKTIEALEHAAPRAIPKHNTLTAIAAAQFVRHPLTGEVFSFAQLSLIVSELYDPYSIKRSLARSPQPLLKGSQLAF